MKLIGLSLGFLFGAVVGAELGESLIYAFPCYSWGPGLRLPAY